MTSLGELSRRRLLGSGAAGLALAPVLARAETGTRLPPSALPPVVENIQGGADAQNRLTVDAFLNEQGPFRFVVDTGADRSVIAEEVAAALGLALGEDMIVQGIAREVTAKSVQLERLRLDRVTINSLPMPVLPRAWLGADGYFGLDVIDRQSVTFNFRDHKMHIQPSRLVGDWVPMADQGVLRVSGSNGRLTALNCNVDGVGAAAFVDSGAQISIGNTHLFAALQKYNGAQYISQETIQVLGVTGGAVPGRLASIDKIMLGSLGFANSILVISDLPVFDTWDLGERPALFIGMNFLKQTSSFTIDYGRKELRYEIAAAQTRVASRA